MLRSNILSKSNQSKLKLAKQLPSLDEQKQHHLISINKIPVITIKKLENLHQSRLGPSKNKKSEKSISLKLTKCSQALFSHSKKIDTLKIKNKQFIDYNDNSIIEQQEHQLKDNYLLSQDPNLKNIFSKLLNALAQKPSQYSQGVNSYTFQKKYFINILQQFIFALSGLLTSQLHKQFQKNTNLEQVYTGLIQFCKNKNKSKLIHRQKINANIINIVYGLESEKREIFAKKQTVQHYLIDIDILELKIKQLNEQIEKKESYNKLLNSGLQQKLFLNRQQEAKVAQIQLKSQSLYQKVKTLQSRIIELTSSIESNQKILQERIIQTQKIFNYVPSTSQRMKIASQQYKRIQTDICDYAIYLQECGNASSLQQEYHPFKSIQIQLENQFAKFIKAICKRDNQTFIQQLLLIKAFVMKEASIFRDKDRQGVKVIEFKTKCIQQFVTKMRKWMKNKRFKQQCLTKLRQQFYVNSSKMKQYFQQIQNIKICENCFEKVERYTHDMKQCYLKIQENYKLGNSFY